MLLSVKSISPPVLALLVLLLSSCASVNINPPSIEDETLLVLPLSVVNTSRSNRYGFYYSYEIVNAYETHKKYKIDLKLHNKDGMVIVHSFPAGHYFLSKIFIHPVGSGTRAIRTEYLATHDNFELVVGKYTVFHKSLNVSITNHSTDISSTSYRFTNPPISHLQESEILDVLKKQRHFKKWERLEKTKLSSNNTNPKLDQNTNLSKMQGGWTGTWWSETKKSGNPSNCTKGGIVFEIIKEELKGRAVSSTGETYELIGNSKENGAIVGRIWSGGSRIAKFSGGYFSNGELSGTISSNGGCGGKWLALP